MKRQNEHIQAVAAGTVAAHIVAVAADTSYRLAEVSVAAGESHMVAAGTPDQDLAATQTGFGAAAIANVVVGTGSEKMRQVEAEVEVLEDKERPAFVVAVEDSQVVVVKGTELEELKVRGRQGKVHPGQLQQAARICSYVVMMKWLKVSRRGGVLEQQECG